MSNNQLTDKRYKSKSVEWTARWDISLIFNQLGHHLLRLIKHWNMQIYRQFLLNSIGLSTINIWTNSSAFIPLNFIENVPLPTDFIGNGLWANVFYKFKFCTSTLNKATVWIIIQSPWIRWFSPSDWAIWIMYIVIKSSFAFKTVCSRCCRNPNWNKHFRQNC